MAFLIEGCPCYVYLCVYVALDFEVHTEKEAEDALNFYAHFGNIRIPMCLHKCKRHDVLPKQSSNGPRREGAQRAHLERDIKY